MKGTKPNRILQRHRRYPVLVEFSHLHVKAKQMILIRMYNQVKEGKFDNGNVHYDPSSIRKSSPRPDVKDC